MAPTAPNQPNTQTVPVRRLPIGIPVNADAGPTTWKAWIPTMIGGILKVTQSSATKVDIQQPLGTSIGAGTTESTTYAAFGECFVVLDGGAGQLTATLTQTAWSRQSDSDPTAAPLLPWNFYYWPAAQTDRYGSAAPMAVWARDILTRYATAVGKTGMSPTPADWEFNNHEKAGAAGWAGHCHNAAPASVLFVQPAAQTINGQAFNEEEMEYLATEWTGNFANYKTSDWALINSKFPQKPGRWDILGYLKPGGPKDRSSLNTGLYAEYSGGATTDAQRQAAAARAKTVSDGWVDGLGGDTAFTAWIKTEFGMSAAAFFHQLQTKMAMGNAPFSSNLRSYSANGGPEQVWNQVVFYYKATFVEWTQTSPTPPDDHDIQVVCDVYSNIDHYPSPGYPATVSGTSVTPGTSSTDCWLYHNTWRLVFDSNGTVAASDARNDWTHLQDDAGHELFVPTNLTQLQAPLTTPRTPTGDPDWNYMIGNPVLGTEFLTYAAINARYK